MGGIRHFVGCQHSWGAVGTVLDGSYFRLKYSSEYGYHNKDKLWQCFSEFAYLVALRWPPRLSVKRSLLSIGVCFSTSTAWLNDAELQLLNICCGNDEKSDAKQAERWGSD